MNELFPAEKVFTSQTNTLIGNWPVNKGDHITLVERGDGLWNVFINGTKIPHAIDENFAETMAGFKLKEV